ncbi:HEXXH motif domain-containing protein [Nocardiopsis sp. CNR-923]|uniref:HEXXH motif domain-containing protein n=1 Tax=Nocardiopsis sp. CNR-923 TaxID=1904965 RepID=UPI00095F0779|nr:HEXXH motif domain-containing protein [Nocardiopsis sp. CNR-923]OLT26960.1 HEXXH motif domain-containing protein [Nocardiopsis sp. CNR-923]
MPSGDPLPDEVFDALARGGGGHAVTGLLRRAQYTKHLLLVRRVLDAALTRDHPDAPRVRAAYDLLASAQEADPGAVSEVLRHPAVGVWARRTVLALGGRRDESPRVGALSALSAAAALRAGVSARVRVPLFGPTAPLPALGRALLGRGEGDGAVVETQGGRARLSRGSVHVDVPADPHEDAPGWHALRRMSAEHAGRRIDLVLDDQDPDRLPGADLLARRLTGKEADRWRGSLREAWALLVTDHWTIAEETADTVVALTPMTAPGGAHTSATARHAFGNLGTSHPPSPVLFALTFAHEVQHAKLMALLDLVPLTLPDDGSTYYAPWRPDPRPVSGLLQGVYAHLGVAGFWRRHRGTATGTEARRAHAEFAHWRAAAHDAAGTVAESGRLTPQGERFLTATARTLASWTAEEVPEDATAAADSAAHRHLDRWRARDRARVNADHAPSGRPPPA